MTYRVNLFKFFFSMDDHLFRIQKAEKINNLWKVSGLLLLCSVIIYAWMAYLGIGTNLISANAVNLTEAQYESSKFWFIIGRAAYGLLFSVIILFLPSLLFYLLTDIPYQKLMIMQQMVLAIMLVERVIWIPLATLIGLDWYVSPLSFGIIASYLTETPWVIYFFGAISLFQFSIIWLQVKYLGKLSVTRKSLIWLTVILLHLVSWCLAAAIAFTDSYMISGWFN
ncbi:hypothetical protein [Oceanobacillus chungangensis]|uniref:Yip1 domain-containing protein n=1 Tax=Oceanobacillus chungangensis TaxID=1229152 RepID=A0A3D8PR62_9BACI|nr:hypothetical protein [Oceanobacillus chungangensis]RDW18620.1 hypothetical protein CWR45_09900 [Oceanobacillus chungangensis]